MTDFFVPENPLTHEELIEVANLSRELDELRRKKEAIDAVVKERMAPVVGRMDKIKERMRGYLERVRDPTRGTASIQAGAGTFYFHTTRTMKITDRLALEREIKEGRVPLEILGDKLNKECVQNILKDQNPGCPEDEAENKTIPGVSTSKFNTVMYRTKG